MQRSTFRMLGAIFALASTLTVCGQILTSSTPASAAPTVSETTGSTANTWTNYTNAGGNEGPQIGIFQTVQITCRLTGFKVADGNTWWYQIASSPWNNNYFVSADPFYNNGATSGSLSGTPFYDPNVPVCGGGGAKSETTGSTANTWTDYSDAGGNQGPTIPSNDTVSITCAIQGFRVADGNTWWYEVASSPWNNAYYVSADAFYNNGATSGSLHGTPFVDPAVPICGGGPTSPPPPGGSNEITGSTANTWTNYTNAGGTQGPTIPTHTTVSIACAITGFRVADGNTWWYEVASSPWNGAYYVSADAFYNNGASSGSLIGTPFVDPSVPPCAAPSTPRPSGETTGGAANTWANYSHAGAAEGPTIPSGATVQVSCRVTGFRVADGDTWWYLVSSAPWDNYYYVSADPFYNNGATSGSLTGTPFVDTSVPICVNNQEAPIYSTAYGSSSASSHSTSCVSGDPVDCASGDFWQTFTDLAVPGRGPGLNLTRTYNDLTASAAGMFGNGWSSSYDQHLTLGGRDGSILITLADGSQLIAEPNGSGGFTLPTSTDDTLTQNGNGTYTLTERATEFLTFSSSGLLTSIADLNGYQTTLAYNGSNQLISVTDAAGRILQVNHGANGLVSSVGDPMGRTTTYAYDASGNLISVTDPLGRVTTFSYNSSFQMLTMTDPRGGVVTNTYNGQGQVTVQKDPAGRTTTYAYTGDNFSSLGGTTTITDPRGNVEVEKYANGFFTQAIKTYGTPEQATWTYTYDPVTYGLTSVTDPNGNVTTHTYNATGQVLSTTDPLGHTTAYTYNQFGEVLTTTTPMDEVTTKTYDAAGNLLTTTDAVGHTTSNTYGDPSFPGDLTSVTDPDGDVSSYTYDRDGDQTSKSVSPTSGVTDTTNASYDADGEQVCLASADATAAGKSCPAAGAPRVADTTSTVHDADGEVTSETDPTGNTATYAYDADGNKIKETDLSGHSTTYTYDSDNELTATTEANGSKNSSTYDADGNVASTTDANGHVTTKTYDPLNQLVSTTNPLGETTTYTYDLDGNRTATTNPSRQTTTDSYNADNELIGISYSDGTTPKVAYSYDADGQRTSMTDRTGTTSYTYDALGRLTSSTNEAGQTVGHGYDPDGNVTALTYPNGKTVTEVYDHAGNLVSVADWLGHTSTFTYDADGNVISDVDGSTRPITDAYAYDFDGDVTSITSAKAFKTLQSLTYARNAGDLVASESSSGKVAESYSYDSVNQLTSDSQSSYGYDAAGNVTHSPKNSPLTYNAGDELVSSGKATTARTYAYDAEGDRTSMTRSTGKGAKYNYDQAGRMIAFSKGLATTTYAYNGDGLRMSKTVGNNAATPFTWNTVATTPLLLADGTASYVYGPGGLPLESITTAGTVAFYHHDQLGSTTLLTSATGTRMGSYSYDSYGLLKSKTGSAYNPLLFAGQYQDAESGLYYLQARYYDPSTGQFMSVDPALATTGQPYEYAADNPVDSTDPSGLFCILGHNPNGSCRGSNATNDVTYGLEAVGAVAGGVALVAGGSVGAVAAGIATLSAGVLAAGGITQVVVTCALDHFDSGCGDAVLENDLNTLASILPGNSGYVVGLLDTLAGALGLGPVTASSTGSSSARPTGTSASPAHGSSSNASSGSPC